MQKALLAVKKNGYVPHKGAPRERLLLLNPLERRVVKAISHGTLHKTPSGVESAYMEGSSSGRRKDAKPSDAKSTGGSSGGGWSNNPNPFSGDNKKDEPTRGNTPATRNSTVRTGLGNAGTGSRDIPNMAVSRPGSYAGPKGAISLNEGARMAVARSAGYNMPAVRREPGDAEAMGRMMLAESRGIKNPLGGIDTEAMQGVGDVIRNRMLSNRFRPKTVGGIIREPKQFSPMQDGGYASTAPDYSATAVADSILSGETPSVVGGSLNYGNLDTINQKPGYSSSKTKRAFNAMSPFATFASALNPALQHTFGTQGAPSDVDLFNGARPRMSLMASAEPMSAPPSPQRAQPVPSPSGSGWSLADLGSMVKAKAQQGYNTFTQANETINDYGGPERAVALAKLFSGNGRSNDQYQTAFRGNGNDAPSFAYAPNIPPPVFKRKAGKRKPIMMGYDGQTAIA
jgi:hypothetical protein